MDSREDVFKAGLWHGIGLLERELVSLGIADEARLAHICEALVAGWEAEAEVTTAHAVADGLFAVVTLNGRSPLEKGVVQ